MTFQKGTLLGSFNSNIIESGGDWADDVSFS